MKPNILVTDIEIADVSFKVEIEFDRTPPVGEHDEEIFVRNLVVVVSDSDYHTPLYVASLMTLYNTSPQFKSRINQLVLDVIHDRRPDANTELVDARWDMGPPGPVDEAF